MYKNNFVLFYRVITNFILSLEYNETKPVVRLNIQGDQTSFKSDNIKKSATQLVVTRNCL